MASSTALQVTLVVDGVQVLRSRIQLSAANEGSLRVRDGVVKMVRGLEETKMSCELRDCTTEAVVANIVVEPTTDAEEEEAWMAMPGGMANKRSLAADVPGFTVCFDAVEGTSANRPGE